MFQLFLDALKAFWDWFLGIILSFGSTILSWILDTIPAISPAFVSAWNTLAFALNAANQWAPITEALQLAVAYVTFTMTYLLIKVLVKMIP